MKRIKQKFKKGAASFYIVAFSTLILLIIATSFAAIIISEITRSQNDDLSQSAYDSALAGIEDAKLAVYNYQNCKNGAEATGGAMTCAQIIETIEKVGNQTATDDASIEEGCKMVADILGRQVGETGVMIQETAEWGNNMQQAYTCVQIQNILKDYKATLSSTAQTKAVQVHFADDVRAENIGKVRVSWYDNPDDNNYTYRNFVTTTASVAFQKLGGTVLATPPTVSLAVIQTAQTFNLNHFDATVDGTTDRGMVYLVPTDGQKNGDGDKTYRKTTWDANKKTNVVPASALADSNNKSVKNLPYTVNCPQVSDTGFACSATISLPHPVGWQPGTNERNDDTFMFVMSLPYGTPSTDFTLEFLCTREDGTEYNCSTEEGTTDDGQPIETSRASLENVQIKIDSTGRANDLYRRVEARLDSASDSSYLSIMGPLELTGGNGDSDALKKTDPVTCENDFYTAESQRCN